MIKYFRNLENEIVKEFIVDETKYPKLKYPELPKYPKFLEDFIRKENDEKKCKDDIGVVASMYYCEVLFLRTAILYSSRFGYDSLLENNKKNAKILLAWSSFLRYYYDRLFFPAIENLAIGQWVRSRDPMFMRMSHATETDFLAEMVNDVFEFGISKDIERPEGEKGRYKKEGYERLKKALASLAGINDEEKSNESSDT